MANSWRRTRSGLLGLAVFVSACGAPPSEARPDERVVAPTIDPGPQLTTAVLEDLCGAANERILRAWVPEAPARCTAPFRVVHVGAHTSEGAVAVLAWSVPTRDGQPFEGAVVVLRDGARVDALPRSSPATPADRDALLLGALLLERGSADVFVHREARAIHTSWSPYLAGVALGPSADGSVAAISTPTIGASMEAWSVDRVVARLDGAGRATITHATLLRGDHSRTTVTALEGLAPMARAPHLLPVCGDPQESAIRVRVPDLPGCGPQRTARYLAVRTSTGELVHVEWAGREESGRHQRGTRTLLDASFGAIDRALLHGVSSDDEDGVLVANMLAWTDGRVVVLDEAGLSAIPTPLSGRDMSARFRGRLGFSDGSRGRALAALVVEQHEARRDGVAITALDAFRFDVTRDDSGAVTVSRRRLADVENGVEVAGPEAHSEIMRATELIGGLDGL